MPFHGYQRYFISQSQLVLTIVYICGQFGHNLKNGDAKITTVKPLYSVPLYSDNYATTLVFPFNILFPSLSLVKGTSIQRILYNVNYATTLIFYINKTFIYSKKNLRTTLKIKTNKNNDFFDGFLFTQQPFLCCHLRLLYCYALPFLIYKSNVPIVCVQCKYILVFN